MMAEADVSGNPEESVPVMLRRDGKVTIGEHEFTVNNMRLLNNMSDHIGGEQTIDLLLVLTRPIPTATKEGQS